MKIGILWPHVSGGRTFKFVTCIFKSELFINKHMEKFGWGTFVLHVKTHTVTKMCERWKWAT